MNNLQDMTEAQQAELIQACRDTIRYADDYPEVEVRMARVALSALTAKPKAYLIHEKARASWLSFQNAKGFNPKDLEEHEIWQEPLYTAPPAPVLKPIELAPDMKPNPRAHETMQAYRDGWSDRGKADVDMLLSAGYEVKQ